MAKQQRRTKRSKKADRVMLVDGDVLVYSQTTNQDFLREEHNEKDEYWEVLDGDGVKQEIDARLAEWMGMLRCSDCLLIFGSRENFRKRLLPEYKAHRKSKKPLGYFAIVDWCREEYQSVIVPALEADDVLGVLHTSPELLNYRESVIVSNDKDMRTLPGLLYNPDHIDQMKPTLVSDREAWKWLGCQCLIGDTSDGYKGCPGIGAVKAEALIEAHIDEALEQDPHDPLSRLFWTVIAPAYRSKDISDEQALIQCQMARILRKGDVEVCKDGSWAFDPWTPIGWMPKNSPGRRSRRPGRVAGKKSSK